MSSSDRPFLQTQVRARTGGALNARPPYARTVRRIRHAVRYLHEFAWVIAVNPEVLWREPHRTIVWGKIRRTIICWVPGLASQLKRRHRVAGGCVSCGVSCNLLLQCPHWNEKSRLCSIYDDRPLTCRLFPITPSDLRDRDLASGSTRCGYAFAMDEASGTDTEIGSPLIASPRATARLQGVVAGSRPIVRSSRPAGEGRKSADVP